MSRFVIPGNAGTQAGPDIPFPARARMTGDVTCVC
jgi:hypothetical protein